ncbi:dipeptidase [Microbacterium halimionae]|uniref:dipeptidase n=1 Tax=Microbacterium halimionae TaxID=1526413 RepID=UPI001423AB52|nr:membrane dipeptidase [Microbacterium halimionae]
MSLVWDQHSCVALSVDADLGELSRYEDAHGGFISLNVGYSLHTHEDSVKLLASFRSQVESMAGFTLARSVGDIVSAASAGQLAIAFDLEDSRPLADDLDNVRRFVDLGVRTLGPSYNHQNRAGCGCLDADDTGLTLWGRDLVREMNAAGMVPDGSHCSARTGLDMCAVSVKPMIYSHSCMRAVWEHPRNITDDQARACADTGGVVGITGVGIFLGPNTPTLTAMTRHLEYIVELVGIEHAGVSSDYSFDYVDFREEIARTPEVFDESYTRWGAIEWMSPETFVTLASHLAGEGWSPSDIEAVVGGNFRRVAAESWNANEE